jgi:hypothetical protein
MSLVPLCSNEPCRNLATCRYDIEEGVDFLLCDTCRDAFWLGQANPEAVVRDLDTGKAVMGSEEEEEAND